MPRNDHDDLTILIDTREQLPYAFDRIRAPGGRGLLSVRTHTTTLDVGDYGVVGPTGRVAIAIERKSKADLYSSVSTQRERFKREMERAARLRVTYPDFYFGLVIEDTLLGLREPPAHSDMNPTAVIRTLQAWSVKYGVHVWTPGPRAACEQVTYRLLAFAAREAAERCAARGGRPNGRESA